MVKVAKNVVDLPVKKVPAKSRHIVTADFTEHDEIREFVRAIVRSLNKRNRKNSRVYDETRFYVGKNVGNLSFINLYVSEFQMRKLIAIFKTRYNHECFVAGTNLYVYIRGTKKK